MSDSPDSGAAHGEPRRVRLDERALRVLAHPLRNRLLGRLRCDGPATATALAAELDTNTGATSYHLRKLAEVGLVEETGEGRGRQRWWRAAHDMHSWSVADAAGNPDAEAAVTWLQDEQLRLYAGQVESWVAERSQWPLEWRDAAGASDYMLHLTPDQLTRMSREIYEVVERYRSEGMAEPPGSERVVFLMHAFPEPGRKFPEPGRGSGGKG
jgi:predicted ArsR family transcriptional regulator